MPNKHSNIFSVLRDRPPVNGCIIVSEAEFKEYAAELQWFWTVWTGLKQMPLTEAKYNGHPIMVEMKQ